MGSSSKKYKEKSDSNGGGRKRRHRSRSRSVSPDYDAPREKKHKHKKHHHKDRKRERGGRHDNDSSDVVEVSPDRSPSPSHQVENTKSGHDSLSIDETNKLRAKLGLRPLQVGVEVTQSASGKRDEKKKDDLGEFYHKPAPNIGETTRSEKIKYKLNEHKEKRHIEHKLSKVKLLGESDSDDDAAAWVDRNRKIQDARKEADRREKILAELDEQFGVGEVVEQEKREKRLKKYTEKNLKGLRVEHDVDTFSEGKTIVLTLKDQGVLDEDDDCLVNVNMLDDERYKKNIENKKNKGTYNPYDVEEVDEFGIVKERDLLEKYNDEIDGEKRDSFQIGVDDTLRRKAAAVKSVQEKLASKRLEQLGSSLTLASDYYNDEELAKFKKPKKKVRKIRSKGKILTADDLEAANANNYGIEDVGTRRPKKEENHMDIDDVPNVDIDMKNIKIEESDEYVEKAWMKAKKLKKMERHNVDFSQIKPEIVVKDEPIDSGNITLNSTAEFCRTLGDIPTYGRAGNRDEGEEIDMVFEAAQGDDVEANSDDDCQIIEPVAGTWNSIDPNTKPLSKETNTVPEVPILDEEPDVGSGVGAALKLAMSKGYLDKEESNRPSNSRLAYLQAKHYSIEDKNYGDESDRGGGPNRRDRYTGPVQDFKEKDSFKPNVKLEYIDDEGHVLNSKEAFRYLSHKFHGKGPGKNKIEKRIKKTQQEGLMKKMSSTDTPLGTLNMLQAKQKEMQSPYIVLSGGKTHSTTISKTRR